MKFITNKDHSMISLKIESNSNIQKYKQIVNAIISGIENAVLKRHDQLPSINEMSEEYYLSRDTVEKAYIELRERGIISSVPGKGYFVNTTNSLDQINVFLLLNKISDFKKDIYNALVETLGKNGKVNLFVYHNDGRVFESLIAENLGKYNYYVVIPHTGIDGDVAQVLNDIPKNKLIVLDKEVKGLLQDEYRGVFQNFEKDLFNALHSLSDLLEKYNELVLVFPEDGLHPKEIKSGFIRYCEENFFRYRIINKTTESKLRSAYITLEEEDLIQLVKFTKMKNMKLGEDLGIISYNDEPWKELLLDGITVISTDFRKMGEVTGSMILSRKKVKAENPFHVFRRKSL